MVTAAMCEGFAKAQSWRSRERKKYVEPAPRMNTEEVLAETPDARRNDTRGLRGGAVRSNAFTVAQKIMRSLERRISAAGEFPGRDAKHSKRERSHVSLPEGPGSADNSDEPYGADRRMC
jgi:hypothetical protein